MKLPVWKNNHTFDPSKWTWNGKGLCSNELFPNKRSFLIFVAYMALFINHGLLITASQKSDGSYAYSITTVVLFTEVIKLIAASAINIGQTSWRTSLKAVVTYKRVLLLYFIPALLYCFYNNLAFVNLTAFDPTTYFLLMQLRVVLTGLLFQILFKRRLSVPQWLCLLLLTLGCVIKEFDWDWVVKAFTSTIPDIPNLAPANSRYVEATLSLNYLFHVALILLQVFCSCMAGVYCEYLLKDGGGGCPLMVQNVFMYLDSIVSNVVLLLFLTFSSTNASATPFPLSWIAMVGVFQRPLVIAIMINSAVAGLITSLFLKNFNSILKTFASALELGFTAVLSAIFFSIPLDIPTVISVLIVSVSLYFYSKQPVTNTNAPSLVNPTRECTV